MPRLDRTSNTFFDPNDSIPDTLGDLETFSSIATFQNGVNVIGTATSDQVTTDKIVVSGDIQVTGSHSVFGSQTKAMGIYAAQLVLIPYDSHYAVLRGHDDAPSGGTNCASLSVGVNNGFYIDSNGNAEIAGDIFTKVGGGTFSGESDERLKENIENFELGLEVIDQIQPRTFSFKKDPESKIYVGVIAQEMQLVYPKAVYQGPGEFLHFDGSDLVYLLINAVKELKELVDQLTAKVDEQEKIIDYYLFS